MENAKERQMYLKDVSSDGPCTKGVNSAAANKSALGDVQLKSQVQLS